MASLFRVLPYLETAGNGEPGHPLHVPLSTGTNRIDNPDVYDTLYLGDDPSCAVAEAFGWAPRWNAGLLRGSRALPGSVRALVRYELADDVQVCDLDDTSRLAGLGLRPSRVVTRDRTVTQAWARRLYDARTFAGVRWWSYYNPDWGSIGLWNTDALTVMDIAVLTVEHPAFVAAAGEITRIIE